MPLNNPAQRSGDERFGDENEPLTAFEKALLKRFLSNPLEFPADFWGAVRGNMEINPPSLLVSNIEGAQRAHRRVRDDGTLPSSATNGDLLLLDFDGSGVTNGPDVAVMWQFVYRPDLDATYPWHFVGGPPAFTRYDGDLATTSTSYTSITNTPELDVPFAGDYMVGHGYRTVTNLATSGYLLFQAHRINTDAVPNPAEIAVGGEASSGATTKAHTGRQFTHEAGLSADDTVNLRHKTTTGVSSTWNNAYIDITPVKIG